MTVRFDVEVSLALGADPSADPFTWTWTDITDRVLIREGGITITRGRRYRQSRPEPSSASLLIDNAEGRFSRHNPLSPYYGRLTKNTPLRVRVRRAHDTFTRLESDGWGTADSGQDWSLFWLSGSDADFDVDGSGGTMVVDGAARYRAAYLDVALRDVEVRCSVTADVADVTGGAIEPGNIMLRGQDVQTYYLVRVTVGTDESVAMTIFDPAGNSLDTATVAGLTWTGQTLKVAARVDGPTIRGKVWDASGDEPSGWVVEATDTSITKPGFVGVRNGVAAGNADTPVTFTIDDFEVSVTRFTGHVSEWPTSWEPTASHLWVNLRADGPLRRLARL